MLCGVSNRCRNGLGKKIAKAGKSMGKKVTESVCLLLDA